MMTWYGLRCAHRELVAPTSIAGGRAAAPPRRASMCCAGTPASVAARARRCARTLGSPLQFPSVGTPGTHRLPSHAQLRHTAQAAHVVATLHALPEGALLAREALAMANRTAAAPGLTRRPADCSRGSNRVTTNAWRWKPAASSTSPKSAAKAWSAVSLALGFEAAAAITSVGESQPAKLAGDRQRWRCDGGSGKRANSQTVNSQTVFIFYGVCE